MSGGIGGFPGGDPNGGDPTGGDPNGGDPNGGDPIGGISPGFGGTSPGLGDQTSSLEGMSLWPEAATTDEGSALTSSDASTVAVAADTEAVLTDMETGADELLSSAVPYAPSDPFSSAQGGWTLGPQAADSYTDSNGPSVGLAPFVGQDVDSYTAAPPVDDNPNAYTGGQNVEPFSGVANVAGYATDLDTSTPLVDGAASTFTPVSTVTPSINEGPATPPGYATQPGPGDSGWTLNGNTLINWYIDDNGNLISSTFVGPLPQDLQQQASPVPITADTPPTTPPAANLATAAPAVDPNVLLNAMQEAAGPPLTFTPTQPSIEDVLSASDWTSLLAPTTSQDLLPNAAQETVGPPLSFTQPSIQDVLSGSDWASLLGPANSAPASLGSPPWAFAAKPIGNLANSQPNVITQILSGTYSESVLERQLSNQGRLPGFFVSPTTYEYLFNPNAKSLAEATLLASHSPNTELQVAQQAELAASMTPVVGSISTWMNPHSGPFAKSMATIGLFASVLPLASKFSGVAGELGPELGSLGPEIDEAVPSAEEPFKTALAGETSALGEFASVQEEAAIVFQDRLRQVLDFLRANPDQILKLGRSYWGGEVSPAQMNAAGYKFAGGDPSMARALVGNAVEALLNAVNESVRGLGWFEQVSGSGRIDFAGRGIYEGLTFEVTTELDAASHVARPYMQNPGAMIFTYSVDLPL
jgi:hypothetical protein